MSGPIVRSGASPEFSKNWDRIFTKGKKASAGAASQEAAPTKVAKGKSPNSAKKRPAPPKKRKK